MIEYRKEGGVCCVVVEGSQDGGGAGFASLGTFLLHFLFDFLIF